MSDAAAVLAVARREIGTVESPPRSNRQKYGKAYGWDGQAWCVQFCWWVFVQAGAGSLIPKTAGTEVVRSWYRTRGQWLNGANAAARPGDLVLFKFGKAANRTVDHIGIVESVEASGNLICIEGNTSGTAAGDQRNGGGVYRKRRTRANVVGFGRPAYAAAATPRPAPAPPARPAARLVPPADSRESIVSDLNFVVQQLRGMDPNSWGWDTWPGGSMRAPGVHDKFTLLDYLRKANQRQEDIVRSLDHMHAKVDAITTRVNALPAQPNQSGPVAPLDYTALAKALLAETAQRAA